MQVTGNLGMTEIIVGDSKMVSKPGADYSRWTEQEMATFLQNCAQEDLSIYIRSGNLTR